MGLLIVIFGLLFGSFIAAYTYRLPRDERIQEGRSRCPKCKKTISAYDNIPVLSYFLLSGKCRSCGKSISLRYPFIEFATAVAFFVVYMVFSSCQTSIYLCTVTESLGIMGLPYLLILVSAMIVIFVIDIEHQIIPDRMVYLLLTLSFFVILYTNNELFFVNLLSGFAAGLFLLSLHLVTLGRGMGLGDVKFAVPVGLLLGWPFTLIWMVLSFVLGAFIGVLLILIGKAEFGKHIAFGPFLVISFMIVLLFSGHLVQVFPMLY